tara:strand:- start:84 stop:272 length:189 start_codon:yes stop_codon:yes gene_type:complete
MSTKHKKILPQKSRDIIAVRDRNRTNYLAPIKEQGKKALRQHTQLLLHEEIRLLLQEEVRCL